MHRKLLNNELNRLSVEEFKNIQKTQIALVLDNVRSQHNIGSAFRSSDAFSIEKIYLCGICATPPTPEIHKSALGAEESMEWIYSKETTDAIKSLQQEGYIIISVEQAQNSVSLENLQLEYSKKYAFVFGNEVKGVKQEVVDMSNIVLEIPQFGTKHSLNVSVSIGIVLWEAVKQIRFK